MSPLLSRREFLGTAALGLALNNDLAAKAATPGVFAIGSPELTPYNFGAKGDGTDDTAAFNRAVREAVRLKRPLMIPKGDFLLVPPRASSWNWAGRPGAPTHVCVEMLSGLTVVGRGGRIMTRQPAAVFGPDERTFLFGTQLNVTPGALRDILFEDVEFDFADQFGPLHTFTYAFGLSGVDNFQQRNLKLHSSGKRAGRGLLFENGRGRRQEGCTHYNMMQGHYIHYEWGPVVRNCSFEHLVEAMDWDGPCWDVDASGLRFKNLIHEGQCIDTAGGARWNIRDVTAENCGSIMFVYYKGDAWPTYKEWLAYNDQQTSRCVIPEQMTLRGVRARNCGKAGGETFRIGNYRSRVIPALAGVAPPTNITFEDIEVDGGYTARVNECRNLQLHRMTLRNFDTANDADEGAALCLRQSNANARTINESDLSGAVSDINIAESRGMGMVVSGPSNLTIDRVRVEGYNLANQSNTRFGVLVERLDLKPGRLRLGDIAASKGVGSVADIEIQSAKALPGKVEVIGPLTGTRRPG